MNTFIWLDIEVLADREEELQTLFAQLAEEDKSEELPEIIIDTPPSWDWLGDAA